MARKPKKKVPRLPLSERVDPYTPSAFVAAPRSIDDYSKDEGMKDPDYENRLQDAFGHQEEKTERYHRGRPAPLDKIFR